jgi:hypothetical protein
MALGTSNQQYIPNIVTQPYVPPSGGHNGFTLARTGYPARLWQGLISHDNLNQALPMALIPIIGNFGPFEMEGGGYGGGYLMQGYSNPAPVVYY